MERMRRLLQFGCLFLLLVTFVTPLSEWFDRWDAPGLSNDAEFAIFALVLTLCLVLLVSRLVSTLALLIRLIAEPHRQPAERSGPMPAHSLIAFFVPPLSPPPLRI
jgi:hypothetical protein